MIRFLYFCFGLSVCISCNEPHNVQVYTYVYTLRSPPKEVTSIIHTFFHIPFQRPACTVNTYDPYSYTGYLIGDMLKTRARWWCFTRGQEASATRVRSVPGRCMGHSACVVTPPDLCIDQTFVY